MENEGRISLLPGLIAPLILGSISAQAETLFYVSFNKSLKADVAGGEPAPIGADAPVIAVFTEITKGGRGVKKSRAKSR